MSAIVTYLNALDRHRLQCHAVLQSDLEDDALWENYYRTLTEAGITSLAATRTAPAVRECELESQCLHAEAMAHTGNVPHGLIARWQGLLDGLQRAHEAFLSRVLVALEEPTPEPVDWIMAHAEEVAEARRQWGP